MAPPLDWVSTFVKLIFDYAKDFILFQFHFHGTKILFFVMLSYLMALKIQLIQLIDLTVSRSKWKVENPRFPGIGAEVNVFGSMVYGSFLNGYSSFSKRLFFSYFQLNV